MTPREQLIAAGLLVPGEERVPTEPEHDVPVLRMGEALRAKAEARARMNLERDKADPRGRLLRERAELARVQSHQGQP